MTLAPELVRVPAPWKQGSARSRTSRRRCGSRSPTRSGFEALPPPGPRGVATAATGGAAVGGGVSRLGAEPGRAARPDRRAAARRVPVRGGGRRQVRRHGAHAGAIGDRGGAGAFFATPVDLLPSERVPGGRLPRRGGRGRSQFDARALLDRASIRLPADAHSMLVLVNVDLYVCERAALCVRVVDAARPLGVVGFSRLDPAPAAVRPGRGAGGAAAARAAGGRARGRAHVRARSLPGVSLRDERDLGPRGARRDPAAAVSAVPAQAAPRHRARSAGPRRGAAAGVRRARARRGGGLAGRARAATRPRSVPR
jgi:hypothetical protein